VPGVGCFAGVGATRAAAGVGLASAGVGPTTVGEGRAATGVGLATSGVGPPSAGTGVDLGWVEGDVAAGLAAFPPACGELAGALAAVADGAGLLAPEAGLAGARRTEPDDLRVEVLVFVDAPIDSRSLRATGASTVDDAERANSPIPFSFSSTSLLSRSSSLASSYTRTLDTFLLSGSVRYLESDPWFYVITHIRGIIGCSSRLRSENRRFSAPAAIHEPRLQPTQTHRGVAPWKTLDVDLQRQSIVGRSASIHPGLPVAGYRRESLLTPSPQHATDRIDGLVDDNQHMCEGTSECSGLGHCFVSSHLAWLLNENPIDTSVPISWAPQNHSVWVSIARYSSVWTIFVDSTDATELVGSAFASGSSSSERMSIRQPVNRAASRAFCPSRPIARESW
jgi:hypothetical protein